MVSQLVIITGLSGSGMSSAMNVFEDLGYFCVDNLPIQLIPAFVHLCERKETGISHAALVVDIREGEFLASFPQTLEQIRAREDFETTVLFFDASEAALQRRFSETRRPHPLGEGTILEAIAAEREQFEPIRQVADMVIDTSDHTVHSLRELLRTRFGSTPDASEMQLNVLSFGYKYGVPLDADLLFDVRFLPNPHFVPELKPLTGNDQPVIDFLHKSGEVKETVSRFSELLAFLLPLYRREGKSYVTVGIGCTGGKHRSVAVANAVARWLTGEGYAARVSHRDIKK